MDLVRFRRPSRRSTFPNLLDDFFSPSFFEFSDFSNGLKRPQTNIIENENGYTIELAVPGINKNDVEIKIEKDQLIVASKIRRKGSH